MILRRITANFRRQDWSAVVIELVVVVAGVFIGLQASNWNQQRVSNQPSSVFTTRLKADLRDEVWGYQHLIDYYRDVLANTERSADALNGKQALTDEALLISLYRATQLHFNIRHRSTYDELKSTGSLDLIRDDALRNAAMLVYTTPVINQIIAENSNWPYRKAFRMALPNDVQRSLEHACGDRVVRVDDYQGIIHSLDYECSSGLSAQSIAASAATLRADPQLLALLRLHIADLETDIDNLTIYDDDVYTALRNADKTPR